MELSREEFNELRQIIYKICGISILDGKEYLIKQRLEPVARVYGINSFHELYMELVKSTSVDLRDRVIVAITTNETSFFRDAHPFSAFNDHVLPELDKMIQIRKERAYQRKGNKVSIWSAASSTGQEAYTVAMLINEYVEKKRLSGLVNDDFGILATDISSDVLAKAMKGEYSQFEIRRGLPEQFLKRYFRQEGDIFRLDGRIRNMVEFKRVNLIESFAALPGFDVIFCRNVLIYFDNDTKKIILEKFYNLLSNEGFLILGASESVYSITDQWESIRVGQTTVYRKKR